MQFYSAGKADYGEHEAAMQAYLEEGRTYYQPTDNGLEKRVRERLDYWRSQFEANAKKG